MKPIQKLDDIKNKLSNKGKHYTAKVRVGMATCGISAGAEEVFNVFKDEIEKSGIKGYGVISTGCVGRCDLEPMAEVSRENEAPILYIELNAEKVARIVKEHIIGGKVVEEYAG